MINAALDASRNPRGESVAQREDEWGEPAADGDLLALRSAVRRLPPRQRDALFLRHYLDFDYRAIAEALGVEVGTVSASLHAARAALRDSLQEVYR